ncbi:YppF family protein [Bacillus marinisedimentorum]|uniref:YppF family protein n=1 Tax=Bacillus marinisedimentorum TaxID=1821260 RepID=UPI0007E137D0|nr:YppF family protein [Bacillus marinisedimentorum]
MTIEELIRQFTDVKKNQPESNDVLLDFVQQSYLNGELSIVEYRHFLRELHARGAQKPIYVETPPEKQLAE